MDEYKKDDISSAVDKRKILRITDLRDEIEFIPSEHLEEKKKKRE